MSRSPARSIAASTASTSRRPALMADPPRLPTPLGSSSACDLSTARIPEHPRMSPGRDSSPSRPLSRDGTPVLGLGFRSDRHEATPPEGGGRGTP